MTKKNKVAEKLNAGYVAKNHRVKNSDICDCGTKKMIMMRNDPLGNADRLWESGERDLEKIADLCYTGKKTRCYTKFVSGEEGFVNDEDKTPQYKSFINTIKAHFNRK